MAVANSVVFGGSGFQWTTSRLTLDSDKSLLRTLYQCLYFPVDLPACPSITALIHCESVFF